MATTSKDYDFSRIEAHWQSWWKENRIFDATEDPEKPKYYVLDMFPYPSGSGLHLGHTENYAATDILGRYKLARGFNVLHPMGWDAFGLPAEQYAVNTGTHPAITTRKNIDNFRRQLQALGLGLDFSREINTTDPSYYQWTQWIFLQFFREGLAYVDKRPVNWCPALGTVLANEEVQEGISEVGGHPVERRNLRQWVLQITRYADKLLEGLKGLDWPESTKTQQANWIGKSEGAEIYFQIEGREGSVIEVYTTRPDTLFGATYMVLAPEHPLVSELTTSEQGNAVKQYCEDAARKSDLARTELAGEKTGVFTGAYAINPVNGARIPVWIADYVLMSYGTGAIMAVPAHDERDFEFAEKFQLPIQRVVEKKRGTENGSPDELPYTGEGIMVHSGDYTGMDSETCKKKITEELASLKRGKGAVNYRLRDWLFSRQRYWGEPIPIIWIGEADYRQLIEEEGPLAKAQPVEPVVYSDESGARQYAIGLPDSCLPLVLPDTETFKPTGDAESPLAKIGEWANVWIHLESGETRPVTGRGPPPEEEGPWAQGRRETNTMPQWAGSCWYYLRFLDPHNNEAFLDRDKEKYWGVPDLYMGGAEHAVLHLLYARFWHQFLYDKGHLTHPEPFRKLYHHGIILGKDGEKMSKSRGNIVSPDALIESHGADTLRMYLMFMGPLQKKKPWSDQNIEGISRFLHRIWKEFIGQDGRVSQKIDDGARESDSFQNLLHRSIDKITRDMENLEFNTCISQLMILFNGIHSEEKISRETTRVFLQMLAPLAPHLCEELWSRLGEKPSILFRGWPEADPDKIEEDTMRIVFQVNGKVRGQADVGKDASRERIIAMAKEDPKVHAHLEGKTLQKEIYVPGKIVNLVAR